MVDNYLARRKELREVVQYFWLADDVGEMFELIIKKLIELEKGAE